LRVISHCHRNGIGHRDIKLENVLINEDNRIVLIDFGFCTLNDSWDKKHKRSLGSLEYTAPELLIRDPYCSFLSDAFSSGVILYTLFFGEFPFQIEDLQHSLIIDHRLPDLKFPSKISKEAEDLLKGMLEFDPYKRITIDEAIVHPFLTKFEQDSDDCYLVSNNERSLAKLSLIELKSPFVVSC